MNPISSAFRMAVATFLLFGVPSGNNPLVQSAAPAQSAAAAQDNTAASASKPQATLADFSWLTGRWEGKLDRLDIELVWLAPKSGVMQGTARFTDGDKTVLLELFTIRETPEGIGFYLRHFSPDLVPREKEGPLYLKLDKADGKRFEFLNPTSTRPKTFILTRDGSDSYITHLDIIDDSGKTSVIELTNHRAK